MNPLTAIDRLTTAPLDLADRLADLAGELEQARGRSTLVSTAMKVGSGAAWAVALPLAVVNLLVTGWFVQRVDPREVAKVAKAQGSQP